MVSYREAFSKPTVRFADTLVTSLSRPLNRWEHDALLKWETHATTCNDCYSPLKVYKAGKYLCAHGVELAVDVTKLLLKLGKDGKLYSRAHRENQDMRVELPAHYEQTISLFEAIQRSSTHFLDESKPKKSRKGVSFDRTYDVKPRTRMDAILDLPARENRHYDPRKSTLDMYADYPALPKYSIREPLHTDKKRNGTSKRHSQHLPVQSRGSLYASDLLDEKKRRALESHSHYHYSSHRPGFSQHYWET